LAVVVDTDVTSFFFKNDTRKMLYEPHLDGQFLFLSFMTLAELRLWAVSANWGAKRKSQLENYLKRFSIVQTKPEICEIWAEIMDDGRRKGKVIATSDAWVATVALFLNIPLVTHNSSDFQGVQGLTIITEI
jgi:tRNA(fMet)-specific endonuclease VapC